MHYTHSRRSRTARNLKEAMFNGRNGVKSLKSRKNKYLFVPEPWGFKWIAGDVMNFDQTTSAAGS